MKSCLWPKLEHVLRQYTCAALSQYQGFPQMIQCQSITTTSQTTGKVLNYLWDVKSVHRLLWISKWTWQHLALLLQQPKERTGWQTRRLGNQAHKHSLQGLKSLTQAMWYPQKPWYSHITLDKVPISRPSSCRAQYLLLRSLSTLASIYAFIIHTQ